MAPSAVAWCVVMACWCGAASGAGPRCAGGQPCAEESSSLENYFYRIRSNYSLMITYREAQLFKLDCSAGVALDDRALPVFPRAALVPLVQLVACAPPPCGYRHALAALNVSLGGALQLSAQLAAPRAQHLAGLNLTGFELASPRGAKRLPVDADLLAALPALRDLRLRRVALPPGALLDLPLALRSLTLDNVTDLEHVEEALARLLQLERLFVLDDELQRLELGATMLREVSVTAPLRGVALGARVATLSLGGAESAELRGDCTALESVSLTRVRRPLPARWLARCPNVRKVAVMQSPGALGADELRGARALRQLDARSCGLRELPASWLADAAALTALDLSRNRLERLPSLAASPALQSLAARHNRLSAAALAPLAALPELRTLKLDENAALSDLCGSATTYKANALSPLARMRSLRLLSLRSTGLTGVCGDWRLDLPQLATLDLRDNNITSLTLADLQWQRAARSTVDLRGNDLHVDYSERDYRAALADDAAGDAAAPLTTLMLNNVTDCDCQDYWFARALRERPGHVRAVLQGLRCAAREAPAGEAPARELRDVPLDELLCDMTEDCPAGCRCRASAGGAELRCERAGLAAVPRLPSQPGVRALLLAHNNITRVRLRDVPASLQLLDLSDNRVAAVDADAAAALWDARPRSVLLAGNPLDCSCAALPLLRAVASAPQRVADLASARCADGRALAEPAARAAVDCAKLPLWPLLLGALLLTALSALVAASLARPAARHRFKRFLFERGLCLRWVLRGARGADDAARRYDAFVSFSHRDQRYADALARRLEPARRLCLHERDWVPGEWIPAQIARSVRQSRRTLVLLSEHFLASTWARAELREAYAAALDEQCPRLLLLLLPGFSAERAAHADAALRAYIERVTYLCWDDPHFWLKLNHALPPAGAPPAAAAAATVAPAAPRPPPPTP